MAKMNLVGPGRSAAAGERPAAVDLSALRVALVHEYFRTYAGSEHVVEQVLEVLPQADVFALFDFLPEHERHHLKGKQVHTTFLQRLPLVQQRHRWFLPLMPLAIESLDVSQYDLVISSSHLAAKGVITAPHQLHICYCHSPARFAWDQQHHYLGEEGMDKGWRHAAARLALHYFRMWDLRTANGVDIFLCNSQFVRQRIEKVYRRDATPIYPPVNLAAFTVQREKENFYVTTSRLVPYKRVDLLVRAFANMPSRRLVVIGDGPEMAKLERAAPRNVELLGFQPHDVLVDHLRRARGFVFAAEEDFGIAPVEAQACGTPVIAFGRGGAVETVVPGETGLFFPSQTPEAVCHAVEEFERHAWDPLCIRQQAERFSREAFRETFRHEVSRAWTVFRNRQCRGAADSAAGVGELRVQEGAGNST
jgi:glycosyltransferase involved in cell wall biosynthesis